MHFLSMGFMISISSVPIRPSSPACGFILVIPIFGDLIFQIFDKEFLKAIIFS